MTTSQKNRTKLGLESLETRDQMSVTVGGLGGTTGILTFTGDSASDRVEIVDTGLAGGNQLRFRITPIGATPNPNGWVVAPNEVWRVALDMRGGTDRVDYNLGRSFSATGTNGVGAFTNGKVAGLYREIDANLGTGNDTFNGTVHGNVRGPNGMRVLANGQQGNDTITGTLTGDVLGGAHMGFSFHGGDIAEVGNPSQVGVDFISVILNNDVDVDAASVLWSNVSGGGGNDNILLSYRGELDGHLSFNLEGEDHSDWVRAYTTLDAGSSGYMGGGNHGRSIVNGGNGDNDSVEFLVTNNSTSIRGVSADLFGGDGLDSFVVTPIWVSMPDLTTAEMDRVTRR